MSSPEIVIPTFTSVSIETPARSAPAQFDTSDAPSLLAGNEPVFELRQVSQDLYMLAMRSSLNATLLTASVATADVHNRERIEALKQRCHDEDAYRVEQTPEGFVFVVVGQHGEPLARSKCYQNETLARATMRLTAIQSRKARIVLMRD